MSTTHKLRHDPPRDIELSASMQTLSEAERAHLLAAIKSAQTRQDEALEKAIDDGLSIVPRVLRGAVRKTLFG